MEICVTQSALRDAIHRRSRDEATKRARGAEPAVVGHDQQHVRRALWRDDAWRPPRFRVQGFLPDYAAERQWWRGKLFAIDSRCGAWLAERPGDLLGQC